MSTTLTREFTAHFDMGGNLVLKVRPSVGTLSVPMSVTGMPRRSNPTLPLLALLVATLLFLGVVIAALEYSYSVRPLRTVAPASTYHGVAVDFD